MASRRAPWTLVLVVVGCALFLWLWDPRSPAPAPAPRTTAEPALHSLEPDADDAGPRVRAPRPTRIAEPNRGSTPEPCTARADMDCHAGDVFWFDSCGRPTELAEACEGRGCEDARCAPALASYGACGSTSEYGECRGSVAEVCSEGRIVRYDCASRRERCVMTSEGAVCAPLDEPNACSGSEPATCEGSKLRLCVDGKFRTLDCAARHATCSTAGGQAHCAAHGPLPELYYTEAPSELCDGKDNDGDSRIDEGDVCAEVPLVAFIPDGARIADLDERMARELAIMNQIYAPTRFTWAATRPTSAAYRNFNPRDLDRAASSLSQSEAKLLGPATLPLTAASDQARLDFYIPVLFAEKLDVVPPKAGMSTLPNARCGGVRISDIPSPVSGLIVLTEARQPETLAHEMGHYLGLCHTHEQLSRFAVATSDLPSCEISGDGICDTPNDPGAIHCYRTAVCELQCHAGEKPDPFNVMSYYFGCRRALSPDQLAEAARNLRLRRGWFRCQDPRNCPCEPSQKSACPAEMSCHPSSAAAAAFQCELDGAGAPGSFCQSSNQCSARAFCVGSADSDVARCVRPCEGEPGCTCLDVGLRARVCAEDLH